MNKPEGIQCPNCGNHRVSKSSSTATNNVRCRECKFIWNPQKPVIVTEIRRSLYRKLIETMLKMKKK